MAKQNKFGTFGGVFVPSILTILGVIMYLRLPTIIGEAGLWATIGIIIIAHIISVTTGLSVSSIATDKKVEAGGTYFMISRSMGLPIGGTIGVALFVGLSFSVSLYLIGFSESLLGTYGENFGLDLSIKSIRIVGSIVLLLITILTFISTSLAIKTQYIILGLILLSLVSIFVGTDKPDYVATSPWLTNSGSSIPLMVLFGIFFPAVTGFEAGVSMSGDLEDPKKSIPGGSISAIVVGFVVYIGLSFFLAYTVDGSLLTDKAGKIPMMEIAWIPELVIAGIFGATLSSALGSILGAPRILQATALDKITPQIFSKGSGKTNEPRNALLLTFVIAEIGILIGELDMIARIVSIFFITTYGFLNISAAFEKWTSADFRPEFKISGWISVIGAIACIFVMIQLDPLAMLGAVILLGILFFYLKNKELKLESGDAWSGVWASLVKTGLTRLTKNKLHNRNWRPNVIMFSGNPNTRKHMIQMGKAISGSLGILSAFELVEGGTKILAKTDSNLNEEKDATGYFHYKFTCKDVYTGMDSISRIYGFSGVEPNTILMGWSRNPRSKDQFIDLLKGFDQNGYSSIFLDYNLEKKFGNQKTIDIWWSGLDRNLAFAVKLIQHITTSEIWSITQTRLMIINPFNAEAESVYRAANSLIKDFRIDADVRVINNEIDPLTRKEIIHEESADTDLVIVGISNKEYNNLGDHYDEISEILDGVGSTLVINAAKVFEDFEVISTSSPKSLESVGSPVAISLPKLSLSPYPEVASDIAKLEQNGLKVLELFYRKAFSQVAKDHSGIIRELLKRVESAKKELVKINELAELVRRKKAIDKLKNDSFFKINSLLKDGLSGETLNAHKGKIAEGVSWYVNRLRTELKKFPSKLRIQYTEEDIKIAKTDRFGLKMLKSSKKLKHQITGAPISQDIAYRNSARYYQYQNRLNFLNGFLNKFLAEELAFFDELRNVTNSFFSCLDGVERKINSSVTDWFNLQSLEELEKVIGEFEHNTLALAGRRQGRLQVEFVNNLQEMNDDLSLVDVDHLISQKLKSDRHYRATESAIDEFYELYGTKVQTTLNLILIELSVNATKNRMDAIQDSFTADLEQTIDRKYIRELEAFNSQMESEKQVPEQEKTAIGLDIQPQIRETFTNGLNRMQPLIDAMPDKLEIYSAKNPETDEESVEIPVARMMEYYFKSKFQLPIEEEFEKLAETLKRSAYSVRDVINLAEVSLENNASSEQTTSDEDLLADAVRKIQQEIVEVRDELSRFSELSAAKFEEVFLPLSSMKIEESATEFSSGLMAYQGQQVLTGVNKAFVAVKENIQKTISQLFYRRSEGILITRKIKEARDHRSTTSKMLDFREKVNPEKAVLSLLPHYYITLFNGKSSIGRDFWVKRPIEEELFKKALKRYREGYKGGIMIIGERNSGKTAFTRQMTLNQLKNQHIYTVFPPVQGSASLADFHKTLTKATQKRGEAAQILGRLPAGSTIVFNDLELFWEKTEEGNNIMKLLTTLIDQFSHKILFIVNINPFAWKIINELNTMSQYFIEEISMMPFDAEDLKDLVMNRHRSSGMAVGLARLFNNYFNYSQGIPGTALGGWLANIKKMSGGNLLVNTPEPPELGIFESMEKDWENLLGQLIIHKRMNKVTVAKIFGWEMEKVETTILALQRAGMIVEKIAGVYQVDPFAEPFIAASFKERDLL